jgi:hypothetical protein
MEESFTVETAGKGCCPAAMVAHRNNATNTLADSVALEAPYMKSSFLLSREAGNEFPEGNMASKFRESPHSQRRGL